MAGGIAVPAASEPDAHGRKAPKGSGEPLWQTVPLLLAAVVVTVCLPAGLRAQDGVTPAPATEVASVSVPLTPVSLPNAPSTLLARDAGTADASPALPNPQAPGGAGKLPPCKQAPDPAGNGIHTQQNANGQLERHSNGTPRKCQDEDPVQDIVTQRDIKPLTPHDKAWLAVRDVKNPFNLLTIAGFSAIETAADSHSAYGPGFPGWGRLMGYTLAGDVTGEFFGTYLIPTLAHQDPRYHRIPDAPIRKRILHVLSHPLISRGDDGHLMPNYAALGVYPVTNLIANAYVPGIDSSPGATGKRILIGYATDPIGPAVAEFLPDVAKRIHIHVAIVQEIVNRIAAGGTSPSAQ